MAQQLTVTTPQTVGHQRRRLAVLQAAGFIAVIVLALTLRLYGISWDQWHLLHPDERFQLMVAVDRIHTPREFSELLDPTGSPWNPRSAGADGRPQAFAYGALPLYTLEATSWLVDRVRSLLGLLSLGSLDPYRTLAFRGRLSSALVDLIGILFAMAIARRAFGTGAALTTGALLAMSVIAIQQAHFFVVDPWASTFSTITLWAALQLARTGTRGWGIATGVAYAAALACKASMWPLAVPIAVALVWSAARHVPKPWRMSTLFRAVLFRAPWGTVAVAAIIAFAVFEPYTVLDPRSTLQDILREWQIARGELDVPYTRQYVDTVPIVYHIVQLWRWGLGPAFATFAIFIVLKEVINICKAIRAWSAVQGAVATSDSDARLVRVLTLAWIAAYILTAWTAETKYLRYSLPLVGPLAILVSGNLIEQVRWAQQRIRRTLAAVLIGILLAGTGIWAFAFSTIYAQPHTRVRASEWIYAHVPSGATLGVEHWDDRLPLAFPDQHPDQQYRFVTLNWYDDRAPEDALQYLAESLAQVDYLVLSSDRLAGSIPRLPWRYPVISEYYRLLASGELGFELVYEGKQESRLGPLSLDDYAADESFTVYDHPHVRIYRKTRTLTIEELRTLFAWALQQPYVPQRERPEAYKQLLGLPASTVEVARDVGWSERWLQHDALALLWWVVILVVTGLAGLPLAARVAGQLPDRGLGLARPLGLALLAYPVWLAASWRLVPFELPWLLPVIILAAVLSWILGWPQLRRIDWGASARYWILNEFLFWLTFIFFLWLRWRYPDLWHPFFGGEKPMELAYANAVARSRWFPPYDPWFADGVQNYYYYGFFLSALLWKLTGLLPERAFQLTLATFAALVAGVVASLGMELTRRIVARASWGEEQKRVAPSGWILAGSIGAVGWVLFSGNIDPAFQILARGSLAIDFWQSSRAIANTITEFPYFSFLYADLHPHMLALPFWLAVIGLALAAHGEEEDAGTRWLRIGCAVLLGGTAAVTNSWDFPLIALLLLILSYASLRSPGRHGVFLALAVGIVSITLARLAFQPFYERFMSPVTTIRPTMVGSPVAQFLMHFGLLLLLSIVALLANSRWPNTRHWFLGITAMGTAAAGYGIGALIRGGSISAAVVYSEDRWLPALLVLVLVTVTLSASSLRFDTSTHEALAFAVATGAAVGLLGATHLTAALMLAPAGAVAVWVLLHQRRPEVAIPTLWLIALGVIALAELFIVVDDLYGSPWERMNTVFKFYFEAWPLLALSGWSAFLWALARPANAFQPSARPIMVGALVVLASLAALYPLLGTPARLALRLPSTPTPGSLNGYAWMIGGTYTNSRGEVIDTTEDWQVIQWLREHARGNPVILEASIGPYRGNGSRISSATGFPTILGWDRHERQQRTAIVPMDHGIIGLSPLGDAVDRRLREVRELYTTTDLQRKRQLLYAYGVRYVIVGQVEKRWRVQPGFAGATQPDELYASPEGIAAFQALEGSTLRRVAVFGETVIYEVLPPVKG